MGRSVDEEERVKTSGNLAAKMVWGRKSRGPVQLALPKQLDLQRSEFGFRLPMFAFLARQRGSRQHV